MKNESLKFKIGSFILFIFGMILIHKLGFGAMSAHSEISPERLRDFTFPIWHSVSFLKHGFLVFLNEGDFDQKLAYANHSTAYLLFMDLFYQVELLFSKLSMRLTYAYFSMFLIFTLVIKIICLEKKFDIRRLVLVLLGILYLVTMPTFWISAGKFNVDNPFHNLLAFLIFLALKISQNETKHFSFRLVAFFFCVVHPIHSIMLGIFLFIKSLNPKEELDKYFKISLFFVLLGGIVYVQPIVVSKILGYSLKNSGWIFRAGLDGDMTYYTNLYHSIINPYYIRPVSLILIPLILLLSQLFYKWKSKEIEEDGKRINFLQIIFSNYLLTAVFWPQALSIHPYLYDDLLVIPIAIWIVFNFASESKLEKKFSFWFWAMLIFITFNLTQVAQSGRNFNQAYPPSSAPKI